MSSTSPTGGASGQQQTSRDLLVRELERRIDELEAADDDTVGRFSGWDWLLCVLGGLVGPALAMWWFAG
jgi:hypothetical protein